MEPTKYDTAQIRARWPDGGMLFVTIEDHRTALESQLHATPPKEQDEKVKGLVEALEEDQGCHSYLLPKCPYLAKYVCNKCGWINPVGHALAAFKAKEAEL